MKKRGLLKWIVFLPVAMMLLTGCGQKVDDYPIVDGTLPPMVGPEGGLVMGFEGEVVLAIPPGALKQDVRFTVYDLNYKSKRKDEELLKTFAIEQFVEFEIPAKLTVYSDGCLSDGKTNCEGMDVFFLIWGNLSDYCNQNEEYCTTCCYEATSHSVSACIDKTGVVETVGRVRE